LKKDLREL